MDALLAVQAEVADLKRQLRSQQVITEATARLIAQQSGPLHDRIRDIVRSELKQLLLAKAASLSPSMVSPEHVDPEESAGRLAASPAMPLPQPGEESAASAGASPALLPPAAEASPLPRRLDGALGASSTTPLPPPRVLQQLPAPAYRLSGTVGGSDPELQSYAGAEEGEEEVTLDGPLADLHTPEVMLPPR